MSDLSWIHVDSYGDAVATARALHDGLAATATPPPSSQPGNQELPAGLDTAMLDRVLDTDGSIEDGVYHARIPVTVPVTDSRANVRLPADMEAASLLMFQLLPDNKVAANGDLAVTAERLNPTLAALRNGGIQVLTTHNHMLNEQPRLFYTHYWATGDPASLARALRGALEQAR